MYQKKLYLSRIESRKKHEINLNKNTKNELWQGSFILFSLLKALVNSNLNRIYNTVTECEYRFVKYLIGVAFDQLLDGFVELRYLCIGLAAMDLLIRY